ncbi:aminoglycoside phosphotransferase (APT) family kinase protein [Nocardia tenerifensis]|uniref:Aminoglycoside phosphotransferase (APT) family kinase protein n=1 Tax=Nocardia tenerifensis TaxID=228006 RepID=A0A318KQL0_9NOCA|nr:aminoglycoside phosphotransferase family protein [Nocardia tenerifensis]PXX65217.1 aminoglycoside phosphotransferase (APT) family kinase protein [Nocardia tenerifensis]
MDHAEYGGLEQTLGQPIAGSAPAEWGFQNRTDLLTLADGDRMVLQRYRDPDDAERRLRTMHTLLEPAAKRGIAIPRIRRFDLDADPAWIVFDALPGVPVAASAETGVASPRFPAIAREMGTLLAAFRRLPTAGLQLDDLWANPTRLVESATGWAARLDLAPAQRAALDRVSKTVPALFADRPTVLAHGDFALVNILTDGENITGLVDFESVRLADPLFDPAWWSWSVGPAGTAWREFLDAAGFDPGEPDLERRVTALQILRMLELLAERPDLSSVLRTAVHERLIALLGSE